MHGGDVLSATRAYLRAAPAAAERLRHGHRARGDPRVALRLPASGAASLVGSRRGSCASRTSWSPTCRWWSRTRCPSAVDARPLIPQRTVTLVFVSSVNDATIRAVNYARSIGAAETRAIYFDLDPDEAHRLGAAVVRPRLGIPLDIVEAPFRDLTGPMLDEVRRFTAREDTVVNVVIPEFLVGKWRHYLLHNQNALFVKRLFLYESAAVLSSVPFVVEIPDVSRREPAEVAMDRDRASRSAARSALKETTVPPPDLRGRRDARARRPVRRGPDTLGAHRALPRPGPGPHRRRRAGHAEMAASWLREDGRRRAHRERRARARATREYRTDLMSQAVVHADAVAGLLVASALVRPERADRDEGLVREEEAQGEGVRPGREPRRDHRRRGRRSAFRSTTSSPSRSRGSSRWPPRSDWFRGRTSLTQTTSTCERPDPRAPPESTRTRARRRKGRSTSPDG